jgi:hypothetical protein
MLIWNQVWIRDHHYHHNSNGIIPLHKKRKLHGGHGELQINADEGKRKLPNNGRYVCSRMLNDAVDDEPQNLWTSTNNNLKNFHNDVYINTMKNMKENVNIICRSLKNFDDKKL